MNVTLEELQKINSVQIEILKNIVSVCESLNIKFFMVHGSLLGTVRNEKFIPYDDDIDIAMPRKDYELFLKEAPKHLDKKYFVQSHVSDSHYPLSFAKVRDSSTTYIVDVVRHLDMHHGIYVDLFPIDFCEKNKWKKFKSKLFSLRINSVYITESNNATQKIKQMLARILCPSLKTAIAQKNNLASTAVPCNTVCMTGGKGCEGSMPAEWFSKYEQRMFEGVPVFIPGEYDAYLTHIYGDYSTRTLVEGKMADEAHVTLNAAIVDTENPYTFYMNQK